MSDDAFLAALQLGDSALPIGRFVHSGGLEPLLGARPGVDVVELVRVVLRESLAPLDGVAVAHAHRAATAPELVGLDRAVTARKLTPPARRASTSCGRRLAALVPTLTEAEPASAFSAAVRARQSAGNLAVVEGSLAAACGLGGREAVLLALRGSASGLLSAAVRLGRLSTLAAQAALHDLRPALVEAADVALALELTETSSTVPELEIHALAHAHADARLFAT